MQRPAPFVGGMFNSIGGDESWDMSAQWGQRGNEIGPAGADVGISLARSQPSRSRGHMLLLVPIATRKSSWNLPSSKRGEMPVNQSSAPLLEGFGDLPEAYLLHTARRGS